MMKLFSIIILFVFSSINAFATETTGVISTIQPINSLVSAVIGNTGKTISIIPAEQSPHDFKLKPSDVKVLQNGNIIFYVSNHLESSVTKVFKNLPKNIKLINLMEESGINHLAIRDNAAWERHDHHGDDHDDHDKHGKKHDDHDDHDKHGKKHDDHDDHEKHGKKHDDHDDHDKHGKKHDDHDDHDKHGKKHDDHDDHDKHGKKHDDHDDHDKHGKKHDDHDDHEKEDDVHIWLSPDNAIKIVQKVNKVLSLYFPENSKIYNENTTKFIDKIRNLKMELIKELSPIKNKPYIVFHDAYQYFEKTFELNAVGSVALEGDIASSPKQISFIKDKIIKSKASCVFQEPQFDSKLVKIVVEGTNAKTGTLDPLGVNITGNKDFYLQLLTNMAKSLKECLG
jgi:zinc transport system substrate-binding protein